MFRKSARIDVNIEESKDLKGCKDARGVFTVNVNLVSGELFPLIQKRRLDKPSFWTQWAIFLSLHNIFNKE